MQLKKLKGEEAEHVRKVLKHIEAYRSMALLEHYYFPEKMSSQPDPTSHSFYLTLLMRRQMPRTLR